ncbi:hypothetical protein B0H21DRAFT_823429 [Amylocystis lapponica]|nr:hypothetical protein B0H21DRAFT_823429 [Amylocystis lapponica]
MRSALRLPPSAHAAFPPSMLHAPASRLPPTLPSSAAFPPSMLRLTPSLSPLPAAVEVTAPRARSVRSVRRTRPPNFSRYWRRIDDIGHRWLLPLPLLPSVIALFVGDSVEPDEERDSVARLGAVRLI